MNDLAIRSPVASGVVITERLEEPTPGQYWRARHDIEPRTDRRGEYPAVSAGTVHMLAEIETADGQSHVIILAAHPEAADQEPLRFHADDFEKHWERALDGEATRENELSALSLQMRMTQQAMSTPPPDAAPAGLLGQQPALNKGGATGQELATGEGLKEVIAHTDAIRERTATHLSWIQKHSEELGQQATSMARYHQEKATAMMATARSQLGQLDALMSKVKNLKFYAGEGVFVTQLLDGRPAAPSAKIVIYQDLLAFDEELLLCLDDGGIDHTMVDAVAAALQDATILTQMIPAERGLVLVRFRATYKEFVKVLDTDDTGTTVAKHQYNTGMSEESKRHRLLYRDGARVYLIESDEVLPSIKQLLPNSKEQASYFQREYWDYRAGKLERDYEEITNEELAYARAQRKQFAALTDYARVLIILWGLRDRTELFLTTNIPPFSNWLDEGFQNTYLELVSHDNLIGEQRISWDKYQQESNRWLSTGATVLVNAMKAADKGTAAGMYVWRERAGDYDRKWTPSQPWQTGAVQLKEGKPVMMIAVKDYSTPPKSKTTALELHYSHNHLVLDRLLSEDLHYYLTSRSSRRDYGHYVPMFKRAFELVVTREQREKPWTNWLYQSLRDGAIRGDEITLRRSILCAVASLRPEKGYPDNPKEARPSLRHALLNATFDALSDQSERVAIVETYTHDLGRMPVGLYRAGESDLVLYRTATAGERDRRFSYRKFPWVIRETILIDAGRVTVKSSTTCLYRGQVGEMILHEWEGQAKIWQACSEPSGMSHDKLIELMNQVTDVAKVLDDTRALARAMERAYIEFNDNYSKKSVGRTSAMFPIGTVLQDGNPAILMACIDQLFAASAWGGDEAKQRARQWILKTYAHSEKRLEELECEHHPFPCIVRRLGALAKGLVNSRGFLEGYGESTPNSADAMRKKSKRPTRAGDDWEPEIRITSLTEQGARLFPWMIEFCEAAA